MVVSQQILDLSMMVSLATKGHIEHGMYGGLPCRHVVGLYHTISNRLSDHEEESNLIARFEIPNR